MIRSPLSSVMRISGTEDPEDSVRTSWLSSGRATGERVTWYAGRTAARLFEIFELAWYRGDGDATLHRSSPEYIRRTQKW